jgi:hypothetical protein
MSTAFSGLSSYRLCVNYLSSLFYSSPADKEIISLIFEYKSTNTLEEAKKDKTDKDNNLSWFHFILESSNDISNPTSILYTAKYVDSLGDYNIIAHLLGEHFPDWHIINVIVDYSTNDF